MRTAAASVSVLLLALGLDAAPGPAVVDAVRAGDAEALRALVGQGADVNEADADGTTALVWASHMDSVETARVLLDAGANVNAANDLGATALWAASQNGSESMVGLLLEAGADPNQALLAGETPVMVAARSGFPAVVERLAAAGADLDARAVREQTALMWAAAQGHPDVVRVLIENGADIHARSVVWSQVMAVPPHSVDAYNRDIPHGGDTALMFAARVGDLDSARLLVAAGADVDDADAWGVSATSLAAHSGFTEIVRLLLESGADPDPPGPGFTALHNAIMNRDEAMVRDLLAHGADVHAPLTTWTPTRRSSADHNYAPELVGASPLWLAARFSTPGVMRRLLENGADPAIVHEGRYYSTSVSEQWLQERRHRTTPLMAALGMGGGRAWVRADGDLERREAMRLEAARLFVEAGVDVNVASTDGRTALDAAGGMDSVVEFLMEHGARAGESD